MNPGGRITKHEVNVIRSQLQQYDTEEVKSRQMIRMQREKDKSGIHSHSRIPYLIHHRFCFYPLVFNV